MNNQTINQTFNRSWQKLATISIIVPVGRDQQAGARSQLLSSRRERDVLPSVSGGAGRVDGADFFSEGRRAAQ